MEQHFRHSSSREKLIEHLFIGELLRNFWLSGAYNFELARPEIDNRGYDLIAEVEGITRHIQLKTSHMTARTRVQKVHRALAGKPSGCVVWILFDGATLTLGPYLFFGSQPGEPLPDLTSMQVAKHTKANAQGEKLERPDIRVIPRSRFQVKRTIQELREALFG